MLNAATARHENIVARFEEFLEANYDWPVHLANICAAVGVSERTLRTCCRELLGVSPMHYVRLRRMQLACVALTCASPATATVTTLQRTWAFWSLGGFRLITERYSENIRRRRRAGNHFLTELPR
jgi:methylphosphotriester-DNA--protein-cysteine methyltransferase